MILLTMIALFNKDLSHLAVIMKTLLLLLVLFFSFCASNAQITITQTDFANASDTVRMTEAVWNPLLDFGATGANYAWDFSELQWQNQYIDTFLNPIFTGLYNLTFSNIPFNPYRSNIAKKADNTLTTLPLLSNIFTNGYNFYYKTQSLLTQKGIGMRVSGFPTAVPMTHPDTIYHFPMDYGNEDSSWSDYTVRIPQLGTFSHKQHRTSKIDGWGTLTTPYGTFDVLRHVTEIRGSDSLYIDTLNFGFKIDNDIQREYKWITNGKMAPLLQINTQAGILNQFQNFEFVTKILYRDSVRFVVSGLADANRDEIQFHVFPNPATDNLMVFCSSNAVQQSLLIADMSGRVVFKKENAEMNEKIDASGWERGIYFVTLRSGNRQSVRKLAVQ